MKIRWFIAAGMVATLLLMTAGFSQAQWLQSTNARPAQAIFGTSFTYQGQLMKGGVPINASCNFKFSLWDDPTSGTQVGEIQTKTDVMVSNGLFTVQLDFGNTAFTGDARWLQVEVKCAGDADYTVLSPRQSLTAVPYALYSKSVPWSGLTGIPDGFADAVDNDTTTFWSLTGNSSLTPGTNFIGTTDNTPFEIKVNGFRALWIGPNPASPNIIGGYSGNALSAGVTGATISGGGQPDAINQVTANYGTVGGGSGNRATGIGGTVGGGGNNTASGWNSTVAGGGGNTASNTNSTVGGGYANVASGGDATIAGGHENTASGFHAAIGGGSNNIAIGDYATIPGGSGAKAYLNGQMAYASGGFQNIGDAQTSIFVMRKQTTGSSWANLYLDGSNRFLIIPAGYTMTFEVLVVGRSDDGESAGYQIKGVVEHFNDTLSFIGTPAVTVLGEDDESWDVQITIDNFWKALIVQVKGNGETIRWVGVVRTAEVSW